MAAVDDVGVAEFDHSAFASRFIRRSEFTLRVSDAVDERKTLEHKLPANQLASINEYTEKARRLTGRDA